MNDDKEYQEFLESIRDLLLAIKNSQELADIALEKVTKLYVKENERAVKKGLPKVSLRRGSISRRDI